MRGCPVCNGLTEIDQFCETCGESMVDKGKLTDYLDDYSAYMEIDSMKLFDGDQLSLEKHRCIHMVSCPTCKNDYLIAIKDGSL
ncbi:hypothetical protein LC087_00690 [Bacillus carboniphilus]|uniref:Uncharacterized protein n=1 Tax=Bacillus carboniphilus TaxID=86663 RepID=A0ABY9JYU2_9BACI|nr:hypothetical protein [Bacillus carboniphilus]WLR42796.1 hypothetical protein LC087_00690 [Bacillus carboniphilus]